MTLRRRLALVTLAVAVPQVGLLVAWDQRSRRAAASEVLAALLEQEVARGSAEACTSDPERFGGRQRPPEDRDHQPQRRDEAPRDGPHGAPPQLWTYDASGAPAQAAAPTLAPEALSSLRPGEIGPVHTAWLGSVLRVGTRTGWGGACEIAVLEGTTVPGWMGAVIPASPLWLAPLIGSLLGILIASGSVVARIQRLTEAVQRVAADGYRAPVAVPGADEVAALAQAFDQAGRALQAQIAETQRRERALREFMANTSHDVLLPLTVLRGHLAALREQSERGPIHHDTLLSAMDEAHYLGALVHDLAAIASLDAAERAPAWHPVDLVALVERVHARHVPVGRDRQVEVVAAVPGEPATASGDVTLLEQAVNNLVYNAVRYNRPGGHVALTLEVGAGAFALRVIDDGPGVPAEQLEHLTERGFRADEARSRAPEGLGIGLSIAARVAEAHRFSLSFQASEAGGLEARLAGTLISNSLNQS